METTNEQAETAANGSGEGDAPAQEAPAKAAAAPEKKGSAGASKAPMAQQIDDLFATVRRLEAFAAEEAKRVSGKLVPEVESRAKQNIWVTILLALGLGLILGIWLTGGRRRE